MGFEWDPFKHLSDHPPLERPPIPITIDMVKKVVSEMKLSKAAGPSGVVKEMTRAAVDTGVTMMRDLVIAIIRGGKVPADWEQSFIICLYNGNGDMLWTETTIEDCKLKEQAMKAFKWTAYNLIRQVVTINKSQFGFVPGRGTTDAIFVEIFHGRKTDLYGYCRPREDV